MAIRNVSSIIVGLVVMAAGRSALAAPETRADAWTQDLDFLATEFPKKEGGLTPEEKAAFDAQIATVRANLGTWDDEHIIAGVMRAVACSRNGHTHANPPKGDARYGAVPIRLWAFDDGYFVVRARPEFARLLGAKVVSIGGHPIHEAVARMSETFYGNASWDQFVSSTLLTVPAMLYGTDLSTTRDRAEFGFVTPDGTKISETLAPDAPSTTNRYQIPIWTLAPGSETEDGDWVYALPAKSVPLYLQHPNQVLWNEYLKKQKTLYVQYNSSVFNQGDDRHALIEDLLQAVSAKGIEKVVVDLRLNGGGDLTQMRGAFNRMLREKVFEKPGHLYVITGKATFSAGLFHAANLKQQGATVVGELVGDDIDFWAEGGGSFELPNSKVRVFAATGFHSYSKIEYPQYKDKLYLNLDIDTLEPDMPVGMTFDDFVNGRDPVLDAIINK